MHLLPIRICTSYVNIIILQFFYFYRNIRMLDKNRKIVIKIVLIDSFCISLIPDRMAESIKEEINHEEFEMKEETVFKGELFLSSTVGNTCSVNIHGEGIKKEECEMKEEMVSIKDEVITSSTVENTCTVEDTCTVYVKGEDIKMENTEIQGKIQKIN